MQNKFLQNEDKLARSAPHKTRLMAVATNPLLLRLSEYFVPLQDHSSIRGLYVPDTSIQGKIFKESGGSVGCSNAVLVDFAFLMECSLGKKKKTKQNKTGA